MDSNQQDETVNGSAGRPTTEARRSRVRLLNAAPAAPGDGMPLAACDCDGHCGTHTTVCVGDIDADVDACGIWG